MNTEQKLITSVCNTKEASLLLAEPYIDKLFNSHQDIWDFLKDYYKQYKSIPDVTIIEDKFRDFDPAEVSGSTQFYLDELKSETAKAGIQNSILAARNLIVDGQAPLLVLETLRKDLDDIAKITTRSTDVDLTDYEPRIKELEALAATNRDGLNGIGIFSQINGLDEGYRGMRGGELIVIMAWTGVGKSWLNVLLACRAWQQGYKPMIVSLEMTAAEVAARVDTILGMGEFSNSDMLAGNIEFDKFGEWAKLTYGNKQPFIVITNENMDRVTVDTIQAKIDQHHPDLVSVDYQQLLDDANKAEGETQRQGNISRDLKKLATRNNLPVINIASVTLDDAKKTSQPPELFHVAWAKRIAYDAHLVLALGKQDNLISVVARKNRRGPEFSFMLDFDFDAGRVTELYDLD